jgi:hypothetical protein
VLFIGITFKTLMQQLNKLECLVGSFRSVICLQVRQEPILGVDC